MHENLKCFGEKVGGVLLFCEICEHGDLKKKIINWCQSFSKGDFCMVLEAFAYIRLFAASCSPIVFYSVALCMLSETLQYCPLKHIYI